jgi:hypothetical protein
LEIDMKKLFSIIIKFCLIAILVVAVVFIGLLTYYFITMKSAQDFLPDTFSVYVRVHSIKTFYENVLDLKAAEIVFSEVRELKSIQRAIADFKSEEFSRSAFFKKLLEVEAHVVLNSDQTPVIVFDPGLFSLPLRLFPLIEPLIKIDKLEITKLRRNHLTLYSIDLSDKDKIFFAINNNLVFVSTKPEPIEACYSLHDRGKTLKNNKEASALWEKLGSPGMAGLIVNTQSIVGTLSQTNPLLKSIFANVSFNGYSAVSFSVSNEKLELEAITDFTTSNLALRSYASFSPPGESSLTLAPETTNLFSTINVKSLKDLIGLVSLFSAGDEKKLPGNIEDSCRLLFGKSADEVLYSWIGNEAGVFMTSESDSPVLFLRLRDKAKLDAALAVITGSAVLDEDSSLVMDGVRVPKIVLPDFLRFLAGIFVKGIDTPYYMVMGDFIFFSMDAKNLSQLNTAYRSNKTLNRNEAFNKITADVPKNGHVSIYYDLKKRTPEFLSNGNLITKLLKSYETGSISLFLKENEIRLRISAGGAGESGVGLIPGYPKQLTGIPVSDVNVCKVGKSKTFSFVYLDQAGSLIIQNPSDGSAVSADVEPDSELVVNRNQASGKDDIWVFSGSGILSKFDENAKTISPFPITTRCKGSFAPVPFNGKLVFFSQPDNAIYLMNDYGENTKLRLKIEQPLLTPPGFYKNTVALYPKNFKGTVYCTDADGNLMPGWPRDGGGVSYCSPLLFEDQQGSILVAFITQAGVLNLWDKNGDTVPGFPVDLDGVFVSNLLSISTKIIPEYNGGKNKAIVTLNTDGVLRLIDSAGSVIIEKKLSDVHGKNTRSILFDVDNDGIDEIFIYGSSNYVTGLGSKCEPLPGFPVKGSKKCAYIDINYDGRKELVAGSFDGNVYAYSLGD